MDKTLDAGYYTISPMFDGITTTGLDIQTIVPKHADASPVEEGEYAMYLFKADRSSLDTYMYRPRLEPEPGLVLVEEGWYYTSNPDAKVIKSFGNGEGFMLYCGKNTKMNFSGQVVEINPGFSANEAGYYRIGNLTAAPVDIQTIVPTTKSGVAVEEGQIALYLFKADRSSLDTYMYRPRLEPEPGLILVEEGWYYTSDPDTKVIKTFQPGDGFMIYFGVPMNLAFPSPTGKK